MGRRERGKQPCGVGGMDTERGAWFLGRKGSLRYETISPRPSNLLPHLEGTILPPSWAGIPLTQTIPTPPPSSCVPATQRRIDIDFPRGTW